MKKVNVILSTYNGEKYIEQLIKSVLSQNDVDVILTIRDDGSSDNTIDIIKSIKDSRIRLIEGKKNLKPAKSFLRLLKNCEEADYYAYCDQDDIWCPSKLRTAVASLENDEIKPALFMSTYDVVDEKLEIIEKRNMDFDNPFRLETVIMYRCPSGCVMVMNNKLRDIINQTTPMNLRMHDFWTLLIAVGINAKIYVDDTSLLKYRIHGGNTVGLSQGVFDRFKRFKKSIIDNKHERSLQAKSLYDCCSHLFDEETNDMLLEVVNYRKSLSGRIRLAFDKRFRETGMNKYVNQLFVVSVLLGLF